MSDFAEDYDVPTPEVARKMGIGPDSALHPGGVGCTGPVPRPWMDGDNFHEGFETGFETGFDAGQAVGRDEGRAALLNEIANDLKLARSLYRLAKSLAKYVF